MEKARESFEQIQTESQHLALKTNVEAISLIAKTIAGTLGPKGLDTMLLGEDGEIVITNDGVSILELMEAKHPAAQMLINTAKAQQEKIGDGTTTTTLLAGEMILEAYKMVLEGVPVNQIIKGMKKAVAFSLEKIDDFSLKIEDLEDESLRQIALISSRENEDIADLVLEGARFLGRQKLIERNFKLAETIKAVKDSRNEVFKGILLEKEILDRQMPQAVKNARILVLDDVLEAETIDDEALTTDKGFEKYLEYQEDFQKNLAKLLKLDVNVLFVDRGVSDVAEEFLLDHNIFTVTRVPHNLLEDISKSTGARSLKKASLKKDLAALEKSLGFAKEVYFDESLGNIRILEGAKEPYITILVSAKTSEVVNERQRIAKDTASSLQASLRGGYVVGGGILELALSKELEELEKSSKGLESFGITCIKKSLEKPFLNIIRNAGFNPLEKISDLKQAQYLENKYCLGIDCDSGELVDFLEMGIIDSSLVKKEAIKSAFEIAEAILRINTIIRKKSTDNI